LTFLPAPRRILAADRDDDCSVDLIFERTPDAFPGKNLRCHSDLWYEGGKFRASFLKATAPTTTEGIEKYLGSGMIRGMSWRRSRSRQLTVRR